MKLDELKQSWQPETEQKNEQQLKSMIKKQTSSVFSRIKLRAILETATLSLALLVFFTGLDAHLNATWVNVLFASAVLIGIVNNLVLYQRTTINARGSTLTTSLQRVDHQLRWQIRLAVLFSGLLFVGVFAFLLLRVPMTDQKLLLVLFVLPASIGIRTWFEVRQWQRHLYSVQHSLAELKE